MKKTTFNPSDKTIAVKSGSVPSMPKGEAGRSHAKPKNPSFSASCSQPETCALGKSKIQAQIANPTAMPVAAPAFVAPRQNMPPSKAGRTCATPRKAINPIAAKASEPPERRK